MKTLLALFLALSLVGCATHSIGRKFDTQATSQVKVGDTMNQVRSIMGEPTSKIRRFDGNEIWIYQHIRSSAVVFLGAGKSWVDSQQFNVLFDNYGMVKAVSGANINQ